MVVGGPAMINEFATFISRSRILSPGDEKKVGVYGGDWTAIPPRR